MANQFLPIEQFTLKPTLDGTEEFQVSATEKVTAQQIANKVQLSKVIMSGFSALNFTDSRSLYQFYNLERLWNDINIALKNNIRLWHPATEPVSAAEIYEYLCGKEFLNELNGQPANYDYKTVYASLFGGESGYICNKINILKQIGNFVDDF